VVSFTPCPIYTRGKTSVSYVVYRVLVGKPEEKRPLGRPRRRWEDNIEIDLQELGCRGMGWIELAQDRDRWRALVNAIINLQAPKMWETS
jgi:hypothetical protein